MTPNEALDTLLAYAGEVTNMPIKNYAQATAAAQILYAALNPPVTGALAEPVATAETDIVADAAPASGKKKS